MNDKNLIDRTEHFKNIDLSKTRKLLKIGGTGYYKIFIKDSELTTVVEILNKQLFSVNLVNSSSTTRNIDLNGDILYINGFSNTGDVSIEYYDSFEFLNTNIDYNFVPNRTFKGDAKYFLQPVNYDKDKSYNTITSNSININEITTNKITFGNWVFKTDKNNLVIDITCGD